jgi:tetratricopeptide (TPR) repeat protein
MRDRNFLSCGISLLLGALAVSQTTESTLQNRVRLDPGSFAANHQLGEYYVQRGALPAAIPYLRRAFQIDPANYDNSYDLALACLQTGATGEARGVIRDLLQRQDKSELHNLLGDVQEAAGKTVEAVREYELAARMDPSEKNVFDLGSDLLNHQGLDQAVKVLEFGAGRYPKSARMRVGLGVAYYSQSRWAEAVESLCAAVDLDPKDRRALEFLGKMHAVAPELDAEVTERLARFVDLYPENASANYYYGVSLWNRVRGTAEKSVGIEVEALLKRALRLDPQLTDAHYQLGLLYEDQEQSQNAIREYQAAVLARPEMKTAHYHLARLYNAVGQPDLARKELQLFRAVSDRISTRP